MSPTAAIPHPELPLGYAPHPYGPVEHHDGIAYREDLDPAGHRYTAHIREAEGGWGYAVDRDGARWAASEPVWASSEAAAAAAAERIAWGRQADAMSDDRLADPWASGYSARVAAEIAAWPGPLQAFRPRVLRIAP